MKSGQGVPGIYQATPITPIPFASAGWEDAISKPEKAASQGSFSDSCRWSNGCYTELQMKFLPLTFRSQVVILTFLFIAASPSTLSAGLTDSNASGFLLSLPNVKPFLRPPVSTFSVMGLWLTVLRYSLLVLPKLK